MEKGVEERCLADRDVGGSNIRRRRDCRTLMSSIVEGSLETCICYISFLSSKDSILFSLMETSKSSVEGIRRRDVDNSGAGSVNRVRSVARHGAAAPGRWVARKQRKRERI
ncbi:hypothetical protein GUJ93_ZPchr0011g27400 [Zizania palustris]|uniref:Uncharacterized protein n=1 Tax=Zizania palustris TaxID=103762 RepID=A0A8J6BUC5_ZIZPA|nr:hypothetical protein GUJ93_ZPchr0011g27400 [Zizania palustris]